MNEIVTREEMVNGLANIAHMLGFDFRKSVKFFRNLFGW